MSKTTDRGSPMTWNQVIDALDATDVGLRDVLAECRLPAEASAALRRIVAEITEPALRRAGRRHEAQLARYGDTRRTAPKPKHLRHLDDGQFEYYRLLRRKGFRMGEAMTMVQQPARREARA
jgi:hypothetical protein